MASTLTECQVDIYWQDLEYSKLRELLRAKGINTKNLDEDDIEELSEEHFPDRLAVLTVMKETDHGN